MRLTLAQELWIDAEGNLCVPWVTGPQGTYPGATVPAPKVLKAGSEIDVTVCETR